jgi:glycosyltransferase involved in cell wall biosynthesis
MGGHPSDKPRIVLWGHLPPAGGGPTVVARRLAADPDLNERFEMQFTGTHEAAPDQVGRFTLRNVQRALSDASVLYRRAKGAALVEVFSSGHTTTVLIRGIFLAIAARLAGCRVLFFLGSGRLYPADPRDFTPTKGMAPAYRVLGWIVDAFVILDPNARPVLRSMTGRARLVLLPPPVDPEQFPEAGRPARDKAVLVHAGRVTAEKGVLDLLEAGRILRDRGVTDWELRLVGPLERTVSDEMTEIERGAEDLGNVTFVGWLDDITPELAGGDVFVSASHREGLSGSLVEACMSGLPVVATRVGSVATVVDDTVTGFIVEPHDPVALADALGKLLTDPALRVDMGRRGRERNDELYGRAHIAQRYAELVEELVR